jgi:hypothetical protein
VLDEIGLDHHHRNVAEAGRPAAMQPPSGKWALQISQRRSTKAFTIAMMPAAGSKVKAWPSLRSPAWTGRPSAWRRTIGPPPVNWMVLTDGLEPPAVDLRVSLLYHWSYASQRLRVSPSTEPPPASALPHQPRGRLRAAFFMPGNMLCT